VNEEPQFRVHKLADATALVAARAALKAQAPAVLPSFNDFLIKLVADVLPSHQRFNAWWAPEGLKLLQNVNVAFATATDQGVMLPTVLSASEKDLLTIAAETAAMVEAARAGKLRATLQMGAGFTISNIGPVGIDAFDAIISPPQTGILAIGSIMPRPVAEGDQVVVRQTMWLSLTCDHRSVDGADGAAFLKDLGAALQDAGRLVG
jgi:pyruvate dehydrogenase E2 component (dihydrolipoamide acetyltransferase)